MSIFHAQVIAQTECLPVYLKTNRTMNFDKKIMPATVKLKKESTTFTLKYMYMNNSLKDLFNSLQQIIFKLRIEWFKIQIISQILLLQGVLITRASCINNILIN